MSLKTKLFDKINWIMISSGFYNSLSDRDFITRRYKYKLKKELNIDNPQTFNEKIQWLKLYDRNPEYTNMVDKYEVKKHVSKIIGEEYIIPTLGIYDKFDDIDFDKLPNQFVIKCTHDSGGYIIVENKSQLNLKNIRKKLEKNLKRNYFLITREWPYKKVKPRIIIEECLGNNLIDYKLMCFNGVVKCSFTCTNRNNDRGLNVNFYDRDWKPMPFERHYPKNDNEVEKPSKYTTMIKLAEKLSKNIPFVRVDFYQVNNKVYFGEMTFYPGSGMEEFNPDIWDYKMGEWIKLPKKK